MIPPPDFDAFLDALLTESSSDGEAIRHAARFTAKLHAGSRAIIATEDEAGKLRYYVMNMERASALAIMARLGAGFAETLRSDLNEA